MKRTSEPAERAKFKTAADSRERWLLRAAMACLAVSAAILLVSALSRWAIRPSTLPPPWNRERRMQRYEQHRARSVSAWQRAQEKTPAGNELRWLNEVIAHHRAAMDLAADHGIAMHDSSLSDQQFASALRRRARLHFDNADFARARRDFENANSLADAPSSPEDDYRHARILLGQYRADPSESLQEELLRLAARLPEASADPAELRGWANLQLETVRLVGERADKPFIERGVRMFSNLIRTASHVDPRDHSARLELRLKLAEPGEALSISEAFEMLRDASLGTPPAVSAETLARRLGACHRQRARFLLTYAAAAFELPFPLADSLPQVDRLRRAKNAAAEELVRQAIGDLQTALETETDERQRAADLTDLGIAHLHLDDPATALQHLDDAFGLRPSARCRYYRAVARSERVASQLAKLAPAMQGALPEPLATDLQILVQDLDALLAGAPPDTTSSGAVWLANAYYMRAFAHLLRGEEHEEQARRDLLAAAQRGHAMALYRLALIRYEAADFAGAANLVRQLRGRPSFRWGEPALVDDVLWFLAQCRRQLATSKLPMGETQPDLVPQLVEARRLLVLAIQAFSWSHLPETSQDAAELLDKLTDLQDLKMEIQTRSQEFGVPELHRTVVRDQLQPRSERAAAYETRPNGLRAILRQLAAESPAPETTAKRLREVSDEFARHPELPIRAGLSALQPALYTDAPWYGLGRAAAVSTDRRAESLVENLVRPVSPWSLRTESGAVRGFRLARLVFESQLASIMPPLRAADFLGLQPAAVPLGVEPVRAGSLDLWLRMQ